MAKHTQSTFHHWALTFICVLRMHIESIFMEYEYVINSNGEFIVRLPKPIRSHTFANRIWNSNEMIGLPLCHIHVETARIGIDEFADISVIKSIEHGLSLSINQTHT